MPEVATLRVAPVKGLATVTPASITLEHNGVAEDRRVLLLDGGGKVITLRSRPELVRIVPDLDLAGGVLRVTLPDGSVASSALDAVGDQVVAHLFGKERPGRVLPGAVSEALSDASGETVRVVLSDRTGIGWDEGPVSILGRASATAVGGPDRDAARYRMLIEIDGTQPYEEDTWVGREVQIGDAVVRVTQQLVRCVIITQSPATGAKDWDGLKALAAAERPDLCLGVIADVVRPGRVTVRSPVAVADQLSLAPSPG